MLVAARQVADASPSIGTLRNGTVYEQFFTTVAPNAFTPADVLDLYLHRGSFETVRASEDQEQDPDRWVSHTRLSARVLADHRSMDLESALRVRPAPVCYQHAFDGFRLFSDW
jgi:hypothetical protein